jgi:hypothetical protein
MAAWTAAEVEAIGNAEELHLQSERADGSLRAPVTMWMVRVGDDLYVRAVKGREGPWFRGTQSRRRGRVEADGVTKDVTFSDADPDLAAQIDAVYRAKYSSYPENIVGGVLTPQSREATLKLEPR